VRRLLGLLLVVLAASPALAQSRPPAPQPGPSQQANPPTPGEFDFWVLSLSWSPSFCEDAAGSRSSRQQCAGPRPYSFVVHGFWPQHEKGWPESCYKTRQNLPRTMADKMLDLMPSRQLVYQQWDKHGTCSGLGQQGYFDKLRLARAVVKIPPAFVGIDKDLVTSPEAMEQAFIAENPGLAPDMIAVTCQRRLLREVRICLDKDLKFRACPEVDGRACRSRTVVMPPERSGGASAEPAIDP
jgi:ribonuclease T2